MPFDFEERVSTGQDLFSRRRSPFSRFIFQTVGVTPPYSPAVAIKDKESFTYVPAVAEHDETGPPCHRGVPRTCAMVQSPLLRRHIPHTLLRLLHPPPLPSPFRHNVLLIRTVNLLRSGTLFLLCHSLRYFLASCCDCARLAPLSTLGVAGAGLATATVTS